MVLRPSIPVCATVIALVSGCTVGAGDAAAGPAVSTESRHAQATAPKWVHRVDTIQLDAEKLTFERGDHVLATRSLRSSRSAVSILTALLGSGARSSTDAGDGGVCLPASTSYKWDNALRVTALAERSPVGNELDVRLLAPSVVAADGATITLRGPDEVQVGDDLAARIATTAAASKVRLQGGDDTAWQVVLEPGWSDADKGAETNGASALTDGTTVTVIGAPMPIRADDGC